MAQLHPRMTTTQGIHQVMDYMGYMRMSTVIFVEPNTAQII